MGKLAEEFKEPAWYAIHTRSRHESKVANGLARKGLVSFLPQITVASRRSDRYRMISVPLFPGYLFVNTDLSAEDYLHIIKIAGVVRILGIKGFFIPVPEAIIKSLQRIVSSARPYYPWQNLVKGDQVRILEGPLAGVMGILVARKDERRRLVVAVELFKRSVAVELDSEAVESWS